MDSSKIISHRAKIKYVLLILVKYAETSSDSSDDEPLATMKQKLTKAPREQKTAAKRKKTNSKLQDKSLYGRQHFQETGLN